MTNVFDIYGGSVTPDQTQEDKREYRPAPPFIGGEERGYLIAHETNGDIRMVNYSYLIEIISTGDDSLAFLYTSGVLFMDGEHLRTLLPLFQQREVKELHPFDETRHAPPSPGTAIIHRLVWRTQEETMQHVRERRQERAVPPAPPAPGTEDGLV
jgi:hypothetical protein